MVLLENISFFFIDSFGDLIRIKSSMPILYRAIVLLLFLFVYIIGLIGNGLLICKLEIEF